MSLSNEISDIVNLDIQTLEWNPSDLGRTREAIDRCAKYLDDTQRLSGAQIRDIFCLDDNTGKLDTGDVTAQPKHLDREVLIYST